MTFPRYEKYKDSGVAWLGVLPSSWEIDKIKFNTYVKGRVGWHGLNSNEFSDVGIHLVTGTDFENGFVSWDTCYRISKERYLEDPYIQLMENDLLITKDGTIGKLARVKGLPGQASLNSGIFLVRAKNDAYLEDYLFWVLQSAIWHHFMDLHKTGSTIQHLYQEVFNQFAFPIPTKSEQQIITTFLDRETTKIDELIAEQQRLIELLKEKRQAVISQAVTKGLNPDVPMKDSGVEWLGEVPEHWEISPLKHLCSLLKDGTHLPPPRVAKGFPLLSVRNLVDGNFILRDDDSMISDESYEELCRNFIPQSGDVLLAIVGATLGKTAIIPDGLGAFHIQRSLAIFRTRPEHIVEKFLNLIFQSHQFKCLLWEYVGYSAQPGIYLGTLQNFRLPVPPLNEQFLILNLVEESLKNLTSLIYEVEHGITLLQERRTAMISAAVTGKIDVRHFTEKGTV